MRCAAWAIGLFALAGCQVKEPAPEEAVLPPSTAPFAAADLKVPLLSGDGGEVSLSDYKGRVVMVDFWATWCAPCRYEIPALNNIYKDHADGNFVMLGMTVDQGEQDAIRAAVQRLNLAYPVALAGEGIQSAFGGIRAVPTKFLIDKRGAIRKQYVGIAPESQMRADIAKLLAE